MKWFLLFFLLGCEGRDAPPQMDAAFPSGPSCAPPRRCSICSPLTQAGCQAGQKCAWIVDELDPVLGHIGCTPNGGVAIGDTCVLGPIGPTGYSNCVKGSECVEGTCRAICDHQGGKPQCSDPQRGCAIHAGIFRSGDVVVAGVCDIKCDPLTQERIDGAPACDSPDPTAPSAACASRTAIDFTCWPVDAATLQRTDRTTPLWTTYDRSACAPGFLPLIESETGSNITVCAGTCAPLKTDNQNAANAIGDPLALAKLPTSTQPMMGDGVCVAGKKGSAPASDQQNCLFIGSFVPESPHRDTLGICFDYRHYTYDHDNNASTLPRPVPSCQSLPPKGTVANCTCDTMGNHCTGTGCPDGQAHEWGCYSSTDAGPIAIRRGLDLRIGYGELPLTRHLIQ